MHNWKRFSALLLVLALFLLSRPAAALLGSPEEGEEISGAPIAQDLEIETYCGVAYTGTFSAIDNEGEAVTFTIDQAPKKGTVAVQDDGITFLYTPSDRKTGSDSFTFTATDASGNVSAPATVRITISKQKTGVSYSDMSGHSAQTAAIRLAEEGICVGRQVGAAWFFDPEEAVSRSEFLAMARPGGGGRRRCHPLQRWRRHLRLGPGLCRRGLPGRHPQRRIHRTGGSLPGGRPHHLQRGRHGAGPSDERHRRAAPPG